MNSPQRTELMQIELESIDLRLSEWRRQCNPDARRRVEESIRSSGGIPGPVLVSTGVEPERLVLVNGFLRFRIAQEMGLTHLWVQPVELDLAHAKAAMVLCNQPHDGISPFEEACIIRSLCLDHAMRQKQVAELLKQTESWVSRRLDLLRKLDTSVVDQVKSGALSATIARELTQLPRGKQHPAAQAVIDHDLSTRECAQLVETLQDTHDTEKLRKVLDDPRLYIDPSGSATERARDSDPRLGKDGNRLRRTLLSWQRLCSRLTDELRRVPAADAAVLATLIEEAGAAGARAVRQLEATLGSCRVHRPSTQGEVASMSHAP